MKSLSVRAVAALIATAVLPAEAALAHGCHAAPQWDQYGYHRHIRHCLRISLPPPR